MSEFESLTVTSANAEALAEWCGGTLVEEHDALDHGKTQPGINVLCGDDVKRASLGDTIIKHSNNTFDVIRDMRGFI